MFCVETAAWRVGATGAVE